MIDHNTARRRKINELANAHKAVAAMLQMAESVLKGRLAILADEGLKLRKALQKAYVPGEFTRREGRLMERESAVNAEMRDIRAAIEAVGCDIAIVGSTADPDIINAIAEIALAKAQVVCAEGAVNTIPALAPN